MSTISTLIAQARAFVTTLRSSIWAIDVRDGIGDSIQKLSEAIEQCYSDVSNPTLKTEALEAALQEKIDQGEMAALTIGDHTITAAKLANGVIPAADATLTTSGGYADAKKTGDEITALKADLADVGMSSAAKAALLACFRNVAWVNENGQDYYGALEIALGMSEYPKIVATFNPGANVIYTDDALDTLKQYMTVKYVPSQGASGTTINANDYTLSGALSEGTNVVVVNYGNYKTVISVTAVDFYNIWEWSTEYSGVGKLIKTVSVADVNGNPRVGFNCAISTSPKRFGVCVNRGREVARDFYNGNSPVANTYPIPIPKTATKVTISVTPSTDYLFGYVGRYDAGSDDRGYDYVMLNETASWTHQGTYTCTFDAGENLFLGYNGKKPDNSVYSDAEREERVVTILFEREAG